MTLPTCNVVFAFALLTTAPLALIGQTTTLPPNVPPSTQTAQVPSAILEPAVTQLRQAIAGLRPDKWKIPGPVTQETEQNIGSIQRDLDSTLPGLLAAADRNPASVQDVLPAYRNLDALYDVVLRVTEISRIVAPAQQATALQQAIAGLEDARRTLGDQVQLSALNQTRAIVSLQTQLQSARATPAQTPAAAPVCPAPAPAVKKRTTKPKSAASSSTSAPSTTH